MNRTSTKSLKGKEKRPRKDAADDSDIGLRGNIIKRKPKERHNLGFLSSSSQSSTILEGEVLQPLQHNQMFQVCSQQHSDTFISSNHLELTLTSTGNENEPLSNNDNNNPNSGADAVAEKDDLSFIKEYKDNKIDNQKFVEMLFSTSVGTRFLLYRVFVLNKSRREVANQIVQDFQTWTYSRIDELIGIEYQSNTINNSFIMGIKHNDEQILIHIRRLLHFLSIPTGFRSKDILASVGDVENCIFPSNLIWIQADATSIKSAKASFGVLIEENNLAGLFPIVALNVALRLTPNTAISMKRKIKNDIISILKGRIVKFKDMVDILSVGFFSIIYSALIHIMHFGKLPPIKHSMKGDSKGLHGIAAKIFPIVVSMAQKEINITFSHKKLCDKIEAMDKKVKPLNVDQGTGLPEIPFVDDF